MGLGREMNVTLLLALLLPSLQASMPEAGSDIGVSALLTLCLLPPRMLIRFACMKVEEGAAPSRSQQIHRGCIPRVGVDQGKILDSAREGDRRSSPKISADRVASSKGI